MPERATWRASDDWPLVEGVRNATRTQGGLCGGWDLGTEPTMTCVFGRCGARKQWEWGCGTGEYAGCA